MDEADSEGSPDDFSCITHMQTIVRAPRVPGMPNGADWDSYLG